MKKKLLFVIESLVCAGAEKSLVTLLNIIDYSKYDVDLQLFSYGGEFEELVPKEVNILPQLSYFSNTSNSLKNRFLSNPKVFISSLKYSVRLRLGKYTNPQKAVWLWKYAQSCFDTADTEYDVAIAYAQGTPTFYVADCIKAKKKFAWVNSIYTLDGKYRDFVSEKYKNFDKISCVSKASQKTIKTVFPEHADKSVLIYDINNYDFAFKLSKMKSNADEEMNIGKVKLLTVGRLAKQKGYDIAIDACKIIKDRGIDFCWYVLGRGGLEEEIRASIKEKGLEENFVLLGVRSNPYPYYVNADIYVQTSKFEGFGLAIAEARMLNIPVVTTRFDAVYAQMVENENGLVTDIDPAAVADGIESLIKNKELYNHIKDYLSKEKKGNTEEIEKLYDLIEK